jgi:hypothetical protein
MIYEDREFFRKFKGNSYSYLKEINYQNFLSKNCGNICMIELIHVLQNVYFFSVALRPKRQPRPLYSWILQIAHNDALQSVELLRMSDQRVAESSTWQHTTLTTDRRTYSFQGNKHARKSYKRGDVAKFIDGDVFCLKSLCMWLQSTWHKCTCVFTNPDGLPTS